MSVRFKFRSAVSFDSVDLAGRRSISVRDLRARIVAQKKLHLGHDFDLLLSDADTGIGFEDEEAEIEAGSSVVIKRVPADRSDVARDFRDAGNVARNGGGCVEKAALPPTKNVGMEDFDDFGVDLYPDLQGSFPEPYADMDNLNFNTNEKDNVVQRCAGTSISRHRNIGSDLSEAMSKEVIDDNCCKEPETLEIKLDTENDVSKKLDQYIRMPSAELNMDLPTELRCSLCNAIFKEAVMIPCCQHSFCDKCVRLALIETARCPKCSSMKCTVNDLLPNLSLRQAIEHFLEAQVANGAPQNNIAQYAPDGESGIHAKEMSCAVSIRRKEQPHPHSPSTTGRGSNQVMAESAYGGKHNSDTGSHLIRLESDKFGKSTVPPRKIGEVKGDENISAEVMKRMSCLQGNNVPSKLPQNILQEEATQTKKGFGVIVSDGSGTSMQPNWHRKAGRNCYNCGSPDHLIRDCPQACNTYPVNQTVSGDAAFARGMPAYPQSYWHGAPFSHVGPYANMYGAPGMMPFDQTMVPLSPFGISPYMSSMYAGMPVPYGFMRMGGMQHPMMTGVRPYTREAFMDPQDVERKHKSLDEHPDRLKEHDRSNTSEDYYYNGTRRVSHERTHQLNEEASESFVDDDNQMIQKKRRHDKHYGFSHQEPSVQSDELHTYERRHDKNCHKSASGRDQRSHRSEKSNSEVHDLSDSSNRHSKERKKHHHEDCNKKQGERHSHHSRERRGHHRRQTETSDDEKVAADHRNHSRRHPHHSGSGVEHSSSSERRQHYKEKNLNQCSRPSKQVPKSKDDQVDYDRWEMEDGLDGDYKGEHLCHKRKRTR